jgi:hypothetical protein
LSESAARSSCRSTSTGSRRDELTVTVEAVQGNPDAAVERFDGNTRLGEIGL